MLLLILYVSTSLKNMNVKGAVIIANLYRVCDNGGPPTGSDPKSSFPSEVMQLFVQ